MNAKQLRRIGTLGLAFLAAFLATLIVALTITALKGQTIPPATAKINITLIGAGTATLYRADSSCGSAQSFAQIGTLSSTGFTDTQPSDGKAHCYYAVLPVNVPTNEIEWVTPTPATVSVKTLGQELSAVTQ